MGRMEKEMETTGIIGDILGLCRDHRVLGFRGILGLRVLGVFWV